MKSLLRIFLPTIFITALVIPIPAHAYGGPGVAIGAVIVFLTVIFAFIASSFISIYEFLKKTFSDLTKLIGKNNVAKKYSSKKK